MACGRALRDGTSAVGIDDSTEAKRLVVITPLLGRRTRDRQLVRPVGMVAAAGDIAAVAAGVVARWRRCSALGCIDRTTEFSIAPPRWC